MSIVFLLSAGIGLAWRQAAESLSRRCQSVPLRMNGQDVGRPVRIGLELSPQPEHMRVHSPSGRKALVAPHFVEQALTRDHLVPVLGEIDQKIELLSGEPHFSSRQKDAPAARPDSHIAKRKLATLGSWPGPA